MLSLLASCGSGSLPAGFDPLPAPDIDVMRRGCPDLLGSYRAANAAALDFLAEDGAADTFDIAKVLTLKASPYNGYTYTWRAETNDLERTAHALQVSDPQAYTRWRDLVLRDGSSTPAVMDVRRAILEVGPLPERSGQLSSHGCSDGWMEVYHFDSVGTTPAGEPDAGRQLVTTLSLARDRSGALLVRSAVQNVKPTDFFGARIHTPSHTNYRKLEPAEGLPSVWLPKPDAPLPGTPGRARIEARMAALQRLPMLHQRLVSGLSSGTTIEKFLLHGTPQSIMAAADDTPTEVSFAGTLGPNQDVGQLLPLMESERADIADFDIVDLRVDKERRTHFELVLRLRTEAPAIPASAD